MNNQWHFHQPTFEYEQIFFDWESLDWAWTGHKFFAYDLIRYLQPKTVVELGTHRGTSFYSFCQGVKDEKLTTKLFAIDTWKGDEHSEEYDDSIYQEVQQIVKKYYKNQSITLIRSLFDDAVEQFKDGSIDLLHIDGYHTYEAVSHDFNTWKKKVSPNGIVLFHDTHEKKKDFGVYKFWEELKKKYKTLEFSHSHGLGVLFMNPDMHKPLAAMQDTMQAYYKAQFDNHVYEHNIVPNLNAIVEEYRQIQKNLALHSEINNAHESIKDLSHKINVVTSSKFYKLWQSYASVKKLFIKNGARSHSK